MSLTRTLRSGVKEVRTYEKRQPRKRMKLVLEESATDEATALTSQPQADSNVLIESKDTEQNQSNTSLEIFSKNDEDADDDEEYDSDDDEKEEEEKEVEEVDEEEGRAQKCNKRRRSTFIPIKKYKTEAEADIFIRSIIDF